MKVRNDSTTDRRRRFLQDCGASLIGLGAGYDIRKYAPKYLVRPVFQKSVTKYSKTTDVQNKLIKEKLCELLGKINSKVPEDRKIKIQFIDENFKTENKHLEAIKKGLNASFSSKNRTVYLNEKLITPGFHELAHAKDYLRGFLPAAQKASKYGGRIFCFLLPVFAVCSKNKQKKADKPLNVLDKTTNFIRNNIGKLTFLGFVPKLAAEASANFQGNKFAKEAKLPPEILKIIRKTHRLSNLSYLSGALIMALSSTIAVKIKDILASKD